MACGVLCNKDIFQNALRQARADIRADQSRALRDAAAKSPLWSSEVHLTVRNVFYEAFFRESGLDCEETCCNARLHGRHLMNQRVCFPARFRFVPRRLRYRPLRRLGRHQKQNDGFVCQVLVVCFQVLQRHQDVRM